MARGYDKLYLDITLDVLRNMAAEQKEKLAEIEKIIKLVNVKRELIKNGH